MAERETQIFLVTTKSLVGVDTQQLVEAKGKSRALAHVAKITHSVRLPTQVELMEMAKNGATIIKAD